MSVRESFPHPYKECFVPLSNRCGISQTTTLEGPVSSLAHRLVSGSDTICNNPNLPLVDIILFELSFSGFPSNPEGKAQRGQYLLAVGLDCYTWIVSTWCLNELVIYRCQLWEKELESREMKEQLKELVGLLRQSETRRKEVEKELKVREKAAAIALASSAPVSL